MKYRMTVDFARPDQLDEVVIDLMAQLVARLFKDYWRIPAVRVRLDEIDVRHDATHLPPGEPQA